MDEFKKLEIKNLIDSRWEEDKVELCSDIMTGYIFGKYAENEHYSIDEINAVWDELYAEKNPAPEPVEPEEEPDVVVEE